MKIPAEHEAAVRETLALIGQANFDEAIKYAEANLPSDVEDYVAGVIIAARKVLGI
jgi:hypothetical protein